MSTAPQLAELLRPYLPIDRSAFKRLVEQYHAHKAHLLPGLYEAFHLLGVDTPPGWTLSEFTERHEKPPTPPRLEPTKMGPFYVEFGCDPMCAGDFLKIRMPDGRVVLLYADAVEPAEQGGSSVAEVWPSEAAYDAGAYEHTKQFGF